MQETWVRSLGWEDPLEKGKATHSSILACRNSRDYSSNTLATWFEMTHLKRPWCWERLTLGEGDDRRWDGCMASLTQWIWVWVNSGSWWWTGKPGMLQSTGSQRVRHDWATELNWLWGIILDDISETEKDQYSMVSLTVGIWKKKKKVKLLDWNVGCQRLEAGGYKKMLVEGYKFSLMTWTNSKDPAQHSDYS